MSTPALEGASKYLNNLLLARGFLQDGKPIDFVQLGDSSASKNDGFDSNATTATVINLIHDLILRRDRDAEQKEALASTIRALRAEESDRVLDFQRLQDKNIQLKNELAKSEAQQRNLVASAKRAQAESKESKEQTLKLKSTLDQVRAKCISDVRKRDAELDKLKNHLSGLNRGKKEVGAQAHKGNSNKALKSTGGDSRNRPEANSSKDWSVENESHDFLTAVLNEASTENVALRKIVTDSLNYLRTLTGLEEQMQLREDANDLASIDKAIGIPGQYRDRQQHDPAEPGLSAQSDSLTPVHYLGSCMTEVLAHCQTILRDPSFVPIEEVQVRDEEIAQLRAGWEKMADRWKEAVTMMAQWRQKVMNDSHEEMTVDDTHCQYNSETEELPPLPVFSRSVAKRPNGQPVLDPIQEEELTSMLLDHHSRLGNQTVRMNETEMSPVIHDETLPEPEETGTPMQPPIQIHMDEEESDLELPERRKLLTLASPARRGITIKRPSNVDVSEYMPLSNTNANTRKRKSPVASHGTRKRRSISPEDSDDPKGHSSTHPTSGIDSSITAESTDPLHLETLTSEISGDEAKDDLFTGGDKLSKRSDNPRLTVAQKLAAVEAEATEATEVIRRRQATSYAPTDRRGKDRERAAKSSGTERVKEKKDDRKPRARDAKGTPEGSEKVSSVKEKSRDRAKKVRDRRRSTLTPAELGSLMGR